MKYYIFSVLFAIGTLFSCQSRYVHTENESPISEAFVRVSGQDLIQPDGNKLFIKGTNLGNWLNPVG